MYKRIIRISVLTIALALGIFGTAAEIATAANWNSQPPPAVAVNWSEGPARKSI